MSDLPLGMREAPVKLLLYIFLLSSWIDSLPMAEESVTCQSRDVAMDPPVLAASLGTLELEDKPAGSIGTTKLTLGQTTSLKDAMGPLVVHKDGTVDRITDWNDKTEAEKKNIIRVLGKRNKLRLEKLREQEAAKADDTVAAEEPVLQLPGGQNL